jgi:hypothetical protein
MINQQRVIKNYNNRKPKIFRRSKKSQVIILVSFVLLIHLILCACEKFEEDYISKEDFLNEMKGEWYVFDFGCSNFIHYSISSGFLYYNDSPYSIHDTIICTFPEIDNMTNWTITIDSDDLLLKTVDLCDNIKNYWFEYENYHYRKQINGVVKGIIEADLKIVNSDTTITLTDFYLSKTSNVDKLIFVVSNGLTNYWYDIHRR